MATIQERREVSEFDEILVEGTGDLFLEQGETNSLVIEADEELLPKLKSEVNAGRLELGLRHWYDFLALLVTPHIRYTVTVSSLRGVTISGAGKLRTGRIQADRLRLKINGSGDMEVTELQGSELDISISGSGKVRLNGSVQRQHIEISGSGDIFAEELASNETRVRISGSGSANLRVQERLDVDISGSGDVRYHGQPKVSPRISGSGRVRSF
jgi:hypothetical protein